MRLPLLTGFALTLALAAGAQNTSSTTPKPETPATMTRIVVRLIGDGIKPGSPAALPKKIYVADPHFARIEDPPDARVGVQKLTIIAEPDAYSVNLLNHTGTHAIDKGGEGDLHLPIILPFDPKRRLVKLDSLQFGDEWEGFQQAGAVQQAGPIINSKPTDAYVLSAPNAQATLVVKAGTHIPIKLTWSDGKEVHTYEYIEYRDEPFDPSLFRKPEHIRYREFPAVEGQPDAS